MTSRTALCVPLSVSRPSPGMAGWLAPSPSVLTACRHDHTPYRWCDVRVIAERGEDPRRTRTVVPGVGTRIKEARERLDVSQRALAGLLNVSQPTLASWERELRSVSLKDLLLVSKLLGVHVVELLPVPPPVAPVVFTPPYVCEKCRTKGMRR